MPTAFFLSDIPDNSEVFIDANIFVYHFSAPNTFNAACLRFFTRIEQGDITGLTSTAVIAEALHRLMIIETSQQMKATPKNIVRYLKEHPEVSKTLTRHTVVPEKIIQLGIKVIEVTVQDLQNSAIPKKSYGLLTNDAITAVFLERNQIEAVASNDRDLAVLPNLKLFQPESNAGISQP